MYIYIYTQLYLYKFRKITISNFNVDFVKSSNRHTNTFHTSNPTILPYMNQNPSVADLGAGFCRILFPIYTVYSL